VITVDELIDSHGDTGLGTYEDFNGEMILVDGKCYRANANGVVEHVPGDTGVSFCAVTYLNHGRTAAISNPLNMEGLKNFLDIKIEERFGLNSMHMVRIDGIFEEVKARSWALYRSHHVYLEDIIAQNQKEFVFRKLKGTLICVYFPEYMDGINSAGWHMHFVSEGRTLGGHVFDLIIKEGKANICKIQNLEIQLPTEPAFDTYSLKNISRNAEKLVDQGYLIR
jgi:acetolactate decarboxylase